MKHFTAITMLAALAACAYSSGSGNANISVYRELGIDSNIEVPVNAASAPEHKK